MVDVPEGWKLVPVALTDAMKDAYDSAKARETARRAALGITEPVNNGVGRRVRWAAMLDAAPNPPLPARGSE